MAGGRWREAEKAVAHLAPNICRADPDGVDIWFFSSPSSNHPMFENIRTPEQVRYHEAAWSNQPTNQPTQSAARVMYR